MPFKHNAAQRHKIWRQKFKVINWREYDAGLRQRGSVTFWLSEELLRVGQPRAAQHPVGSRAIPIWRLKHL